MKRLIVSVVCWAVAGYIASEIFYHLLQSTLAPTPLKVESRGSIAFFKIQIVSIFVFGPLILAAMSRGLQDARIQGWPRHVLAASLALVGMGAHLWVIKSIFGKPRPEILPPYELFVDSFYFFRWGMGGLIIGLGLIALHSLLLSKRADLQAAST